MGSGVADRLRHSAAQLLQCNEASIASATLEEIASKVGSLGDEPLSQLRRLAATAYDFEGLEPNYSHRAVALLMREGLVKAITVNWDCAVERGGLQIGVNIAGVTSVLQAQGLTSELPLFKVHGSASDPDSLKITREDVDEPDGWAMAEVMSALTTGSVVFAGLATVGDYVSDPISDVLKKWAGYAAAVRIVAPSVPTAWRDVLGEHADNSTFPVLADTFFDDLLRALLSDLLLHVVAKAHSHAGLESWAQPMAAGADQLHGAVQTVPAHLLLHWWRDGVAGTQAGRPFITQPAGQYAMLAAALIAGTDGGIAASGRGGRFTLCTPVQYVEVISRPGAHLTEIAPVAESRADSRWENGAYVDSRPIAVVVVGATGRFPDYNAELDIAAADEESDDIASQMRGSVRFISAEDAVQGRLAV
jgi:hypothetical protein